MFSGPVAIVDVGSNSIKSLVATWPAGGGLHILAQKTIDARISAGISARKPHLSDEGMTRGLAAIRELMDRVAEFSPRKIVLVATSAVRDAENGAEFRERVRAATGHDLRILSGEEEASLIGRGLACDPALADLENFYTFDLGGGSLECLAYRAHQLEQSGSVQLGCVRLTEKFIPDVTQPVRTETLDAIMRYTKTTLAQAAFAFTLPAGSPAVGSGGTFVAARSIIAARVGCSLEQTRPRIELSVLRVLLGELSAVSLEQRRKIPGLPPQRADVFPAALATLVALAEAGGFSAFQHSFFNLRFGLAAEALEKT